MDAPHVPPDRSAHLPEIRKLIADGKYKEAERQKNSAEMFKEHFGARGIVLPSHSTTNGYNNAFAPDFAGGMWVSGAPWSAHFFYDYYLYTGDREFLADHTLPFTEKAALFFEDSLYEGDYDDLPDDIANNPNSSMPTKKRRGQVGASLEK